MSDVEPQTDIPTVTADHLPAGAVLLDVREDQEWAAGHIEGSIHVPMSTIPQRLAAEPDVFHPEGGLVIVCRVGRRSGQVTTWLQSQGVEALNLQGGVVEWTAVGRLLVREDDGEPFVY